MYMQEPAYESALAVPAFIGPVLLLVVLVALGLGLFPMSLVKNSIAAAGSLF